VNGQEFRLVAGDYTASIVQRGGALRQLTFQGRDLVVPFDAAAPIPDYRGIIAAPWPNRIADGSYRHDGAVRHLPLNEAARRTALHGLVFDQLWTLHAASADSLSLCCALGESTGYPFRLALQLDYRLDTAGLHTTVTARNLGERTAPYGVCPHPYLVAGESPLDEWTLELPAETFLDVTADRLLPLGTRPVAGHEFDFRTPRTIGATEIDHAFTDIKYDDGTARVVVRDPSGTGVGMSWDRNCHWFQVHTADKPAPLLNRLGLAVEPMTCPPDAFNSGQDLVLLEPGAAHQAQWSIFAM
jgi:aldose 1-epimerase